MYFRCELANSLKMTAISAHSTATEIDDDVMIDRWYVCSEGSNSASVVLVAGVEAAAAVVSSNFYL